MTEYRSKGGLILRDSMTPNGYEVKAADDILRFLESLPSFETVALTRLCEAVGEALESRKEYDSPQDFADYIAANYI